MSDGTSGHERGDSADDNWTTARRRLLRATGVGVAGLALGGFTGGAAAAETDCANGPFEATYEPGTVNAGRIRAEQARGEGVGSMGAASPAGSDGGGQPPAGGPMQSSADGDGSLAIETEYDGVGSLETRGGVPSDSQIAVSDSKVVHALNRDVAIFNKQNGNRQHSFRLERLWEPVTPEPEGGFVYGTPFVFDPRARYDRNADRFIVCATQYEPGLTEGGEIITREDVEEGVDLGGEDGEDGDAEADAVSRPPRGWFLVAVSKTSNPNGEWYVYRVPPEDAGGVDNVGLVDYPTLGFDRDAIYLTQNYFGSTFDVTLVTLDKAAMYAGEPVTAHHFDGLDNPDPDAPFTFTVQPAQQPYSGGSDGTFYLVNAGFVNDSLTLWEVTDPVDDPSISCHTVDVGAYGSPPNADQPGSSSVIDTIGSRLMNADYDDGSLWTAHAVAAAGDDGSPVAAIRWYEIDVASRSLVQTGTYGESGRSYFMPTVGADDGTAVIAHNVSGPDTYPRMEVAGRTAGHTEGELEASVVVQEGESPYDALAGPVERWGDYNGVSVDPSTGSFWTVSQYSPDVDIPVDDPERDPYATRIAEVTFE